MIQPEWVDEYVGPFVVKQTCLFENLSPIVTSNLDERNKARAFIASWLDQIEIRFSVLTRKMLKPNQWIYRADRLEQRLRAYL
jgi:hypothetical protein